MSPGSQNLNRILSAKLLDGWEQYHFGGNQDPGS